MRRCWPDWPQTGSTRWTCRPSGPPEVRLLSSGHGPKNDNADAISVGIAALTAPQLQTVQVDEAVAALRALVEHRDDLVEARTQTVNRLHALLTQLIPAGASTGLTADTAAQLLSRVRPHAPLQRTLRRLAADGLDAVDVPAKLAARCGCCRLGTAARTTTPTPSRSGSPR